MKKTLLLTFTATFMFLLNSTSTAAQDKKFEITGASYYSTGMFQSNVIGEVSLGYDVTKAVSLSLNGMTGNLYSSDKTWGASFEVSAKPKIGERFFMIPSLEVGALGGMLNETHYNIRAFAGIGVEARFMLYDSFFCGFESKFMSAGAGLETFLFGLKLGVKF